MSKYIKLEDAIYEDCILIDKINCDDCPFYDEEGNFCGVLEWILSLPTIEVSEEDELKFYYVDSIDDYWIGQRLDHFYYAKWNSKLGFVWSASRYLPWGEHIVDENTLWKEHTYPSEPREMPFTEWIVGFMKKYGSEVSEDAISREGVLFAVEEEIKEWEGTFSAEGMKRIKTIIETIPSVIPKPKEGEPHTENIKVTCDMVGRKKEIEYQLPKCEKCINYGVEFTEDDSIDTCLIDECHYEPKDEQSPMVE